MDHICKDYLKLIDIDIDIKNIIINSRKIFIIFLSLHHMIFVE